MACPVASTNQLDRNKTDDPRAWALDPGTAAALSSYRDADRKDAKPADLVFVDPQGQPHSKFGLAMLLRSHLEAIGLKKERPELFETTAQRQQIRDHDLRGTFVTVALANGKSESWISDRTGHRSSVMINRYKRVSRTFQELDLGVLVPLNKALPEFRSGPPEPSQGGPRGGPGTHEPASTTGVPNGIRTHSFQAPAPDAPRVFPTSRDAPRASSMTESQRT